MRPSVVLLGFVLGSVVAVTFALLGVVVVLMFLDADSPRVAREFPSLLGYLGAFSALTLVAGLSFYGSLRATAWRRAAVAALLAGLSAVGWWLWPS
jgi:hypothetical protein